MIEREGELRRQGNAGPYASIQANKPTVQNVRGLEGWGCIFQGGRMMEGQGEVRGEG